jgi:hypothetical protein
LVLRRVREAGFDLRDSIVECLGSGGATVLRVAVESESRGGAERFARELMPYITAGPQGTTGYAEGRPRVHLVFRYWPCLIDRDAVTPKVEVIAIPKAAGTKPSDADREKASASPTKQSTPFANLVGSSTGIVGRPSCLYDIAAARSGDKGTSANIGVIARNGEWWDFLQTWLTADRVATFFERLEVESVDRFELPNLHALNFILRGVLRRSLRTDAQGKALGQLLLEMRLPDDALSTMKEK